MLECLKKLLFEVSLRTLYYEMTYEREGAKLPVHRRDFLVIQMIGTTELPDLDGKCHFAIKSLRGNKDIELNASSALSVTSSATCLCTGECGGRRGRPKVTRRVRDYRTIPIN